MESYYGCGIDVLSVTQDQQPSDRLPSPDSWSRWGILRPGTLDEETVDDFFYGNSFLADRKHEPFCFCPQCDHDVFPAGDSTFLASGDLNDSGSEIPTVTLNINDYQLIEDSQSYVGTIVPSGQFGISETLPEEVALEELKTVMTLLSDRTRLSFRDALYRLADNSKQRHKRRGVQKGGSSIRKPVSWTDERSSKEANESKTNVVDRALANIMFNRMDSNVQEDNVESVPADLNHVNLCGGEAQCSSSKLLLACYDEELQFSHEFEVPVLGRSDC